MAETQPPDDAHDESINPFARFPEMKPIKGPPSLQTLNGIGTMVIGERDFDEETGTYVKTLVFSFFYIPLLALGAYRVFNAQGGGWYFLGKVPLSPFARRWNCFFALLVVGGIGFGVWWDHTRTPGYKAGVVLARADRLATEGKGREAASLYREVMLGNTDRSDEAKQHLLALLDDPPANMNEALGVFEVVLELSQQDKLKVDDLYDRALTLARAHEGEEPAATLQLLELVTPLAPDPRQAVQMRRRILEHLVEQDPANLENASRLATLCEQLGDLKRCEALLAPLRDKLGDTDGAAILGRIYAHQGKYDLAYNLLHPFVEARIPKLRVAEVNYNSAVRGVETRVVNMLKSEHAPGFDFEKARNAPQDTVGQMINDYLSTQMREDAAVREASRNLAAQAAVVPAALDLGLVLLQRGQAQPEPDKRRALLQQAEQTFLSVRGMAGESDRYRLNLGQVYYWLGRPDEGKKQFDEFLARHNNSAQMVVAVSGVLREVGATSEARKLLEEAYAREQSDRDKQSLAGARAVLTNDLDDKIQWLSRADANNPDIRATLAHARGSRALEDGNEPEAIRLFREALAIYAKMPENEATLNNSALVHFSLYQLTQEREQFQRGADKMDRAIRLRPGDSILLGNAASTLLENIARELVGSAIDFKVLKRGADLSLLSYLYTDQASKSRLMVRLKSHPGLPRVRDYYEKLLILSPKRTEAYAALESLHDYLRDLDGMRALWKKLQTVQLDQEETKKNSLDFFTGARDDKRREEIARSLARQKETLQAARKVGGATFAVAAVGVVATQMASAMYGLPVDANDLVKLAEEAAAASPSSTTRAMLGEALLMRTHQTLIRKNPEYAKLAKATQRAILQQLPIWAMQQPGPLRDQILADDDLKRALTLKLEQVKAFPDSQGTSSWAMLRIPLPAVAEQIAAQAKSREFDQLKRSIDRVLSPWNATAAMDRYYFLLLEGKPDEAKQSLLDEAKKGMPLPTPR